MISTYFVSRQILSFESLQSYSFQNQKSQSIQKVSFLVILFCFDFWNKHAQMVGGATNKANLTWFISFQSRAIPEKRNQLSAMLNGALWLVEKPWCCKFLRNFHQSGVKLILTEPLSKNFSVDRTVLALKFFETDDKKHPP